MSRMANEAICITQTLKLDYCWVCHSTFKSSLNVEHHHVVPRSYGGEKGPTVSLCCDCHTNVHKAAEKLYSGVTPYLQYESSKSVDKCLYLATVVCNARISIEASPQNKRYVYSDSFDSRTHDMIVKLSKYFKMPQKKLIRYAIAELYKKHF